MKILLAEDDVNEVANLMPLLRDIGHEIAQTEDVVKLWKYLQETDFDLILLDSRVAGQDGNEICRNIRAREGSPYLYIAIVSDTGSDAERQSAIEAGADDFLVKPVERGELLSRLEVARRLLAMQRNLRTSHYRLDRSRGSMGQGEFPLGEILIAYDALTPEKLRQAIKQQERTGMTLPATLITNGWASEEAVTHAHSVQIDMPYVRVAEEVPDQNLLLRFSKEDALRHQVLPLSIFRSETRNSDVIRVAVVDPWNIAGLDLVQQKLEYPVEPLLASATALIAAIEKAYRSIEEQRHGMLLTDTFEETLAVAPKQDFDDDVDTDSDANPTDEAPVIRLLNTLFADAVRRRTSDIHIEPYKRDFEIRYRIDGDLHVIQTLPRQSLATLVSRIKILAELDIAERRMPQDGRISLKVDGRGIDLRVSTLPTQFGERVVMRVLDRKTASLTLEQLGFSTANRGIFDRLIHQPHGIILVTGPTGSGKTTTLYATLNALKSPTVNIMTCEDPIEYELDRISQSNVNVRAGLTFAMQLRAILRQDPDVVLVGEIRDAETAETAFRAALTGHLVLSTLHCNEAAGAPTRLLDMGVPPFLIASAIIGVVAQRLVRRLCPHCRREYIPTPNRTALLSELTGLDYADATFFQAREGGCTRCEGMGMKGRVGIHEILTVSDEMQTLIMKQAETPLLRQVALKTGMIPMFTDGLGKAREGLTTLEDVQRKVGSMSGSVELDVEESVPVFINSENETPDSNFLPVPPSTKGLGLLPAEVPKRTASDFLAPASR